MIKKILIYYFLLFIYNITCATDYYTMGGGQWSNVSYAGPVGSAPPAVTLNAADNIYVNSNAACAYTPTTLLNCADPNEDLSACYSVGFSTFNGQIHMEGNGVLILTNSSIIAGADAKIKMSDDTYLLAIGSIQVSNTTSGDVVFGQIDDNAIFHWRGSMVAHRVIQGSGGIKCCGSITVRHENNNPGFTYYGKIFGDDGGATNTVACGTGILPVELSSFTVESNANKNIISWTTTMEINNAYFVLEKSINEGNFQEIAMIESNTKDGMSHMPINYSYIDENISSGSGATYQLKQVDIDGKTTYFISDPIKNIMDDLINVN